MKQVKPSKLRYAVLLHKVSADEQHYDLLLSRPGQSGLATWRLERWPAIGEEADDLPATALPDHREVYLDYEGVLTGNRGEVRRVEGGEVLVGEAGLNLVRATLLPTGGGRRLAVLMRGQGSDWTAWIAAG